MLEKAGLPGVFGYLVYIGEVVAPLMILFGVFTQAAALVVVINIVVALPYGPSFGITSSCL